MFSGTLVALITPFNKDKVDFNAGLRTRSILMKGCDLEKVIEYKGFDI